MEEKFQDLLKKIEVERVSLGSEHAELDEWAGDRLAEIRADMLEFERDQAYRRFLVRYLTEQYDNLQDSSHDRDESLCTCGNDCLLMRGKLPPTVLDAPTIAEGIEEYAHEHNGNPKGLFEADQAYREAIGSVLSDLERVRTALINGQIPATERGDTEVEYAGA